MIYIGISFADEVTENIFFMIRTLLVFVLLDLSHIFVLTSLDPGQSYDWSSTDEWAWRITRNII